MYLFCISCAQRKASLLHCVFPRRLRPPKKLKVFSSKRQASTLTVTSNESMEWYFVCQRMNYNIHKCGCRTIFEATMFIGNGGVIIDPIGQTHSHASSEHCFLLFCFSRFEKLYFPRRTDVRTDDICENNDPYRPWLWVGRVHQYYNPYHWLCNYDIFLHFSLLKNSLFWELE